MSPTSATTVETTRLEKAAARDSGTEIRERVAEIAGQSSDRSDFLKQFAAELRINFQVAIVAIQASHWASPMMLVMDDLLAEQIERDAVRQLLDSAALMPIACDIPLRHAAGGNAARGIRVELIPTPQRATVLLIYSNLQRPSGVEQVEDLKQLSLYAQAARSVVADLPVDQHAAPLDDQTDPSSLASAPSLASRQSLRLFHLDLDLASTGYRIANESRRLLDCDRTTVLVSRGGRLRVQAVSGVSVVDSRSNSVRAIERLAAAAAVMGRPMLLPSQEPLPPQIQSPLDDYLDESGVMSALLLPLHAPAALAEAEGIEASRIDPFNDRGELIGVIVLEYFNGPAPLSTGAAISVLAGEASLALRNSLEHRQVFGLAFWKAVGSLVQTRRWPIAAAVTLAVGMLLASLFVQVDHYVIATGSVEPSARREVFAAVDGVVKKLHVADGQVVSAGDLLLELENSELDNLAESLSGEILTAARRLASIQAVRLRGDMDASQTNRLALEERQLESELMNLRAQQAIVQQQQQELSITSPIGGTVIGWQLQRRLTDRPVARGNLLLSVADHQGPWSLRLRVPDRDAGAVLASAQDDPHLPIEFAVATQPEATFAATLESLSTAARLDELGNHVIDATAQVVHSASGNVDVDAFAADQTRIGADVTAKIGCGKRCVLRSWFGDVFDFAHRKILFYF